MFGTDKRARGHCSWDLAVIDEVDPLVSDFLVGREVVKGRMRILASHNKAGVFRPPCGHGHCHTVQERRRIGRSGPGGGLRGGGALDAHSLVT